MNEWLEAEQHAELAQRYFEAGLWERALRELQRALTINPRQTEWLTGLAMTLDELGRHETAIRVYQRVLVLLGEDVETLLHLADDFLRTDQPTQALAALERATAVESDCVTAWTQLIEVHTQLGDHELAEQCFYMVMQLDEDCVQAYDRIAASLANRRQWERATWCLRRAIKLDPCLPDVRVNLARIYRQQGQLQRAKRCYLRCLREQPNDVDVLLEYGSLLCELGFFSEARRHFQQMIERNTANAAAHRALGRLAYRIGHYEAAETALQTAHQLDETLPGVGLYLAKSALARGRSDLCRRYLEMEFAAIDRDVDDSLELSRFLNELHFPAAAAEVIAMLLENENRTPLSPAQRTQAMLRRGEARLLCGQLDEGVADCRQALRLEPYNESAIFNLTLASMQQGRWRRSRCWLRRARRRNPHDPALRRLRIKLTVTRWRVQVRSAASRFAEVLHLPVIRIG